VVPIDGGATAVEYAIIVSAIAGVIVLIVIALGTKVAGLYTSAESKMPTP
jgi:Flp pilus assembly pilin Flp